MMNKILEAVCFLMLLALPGVVLTVRWRRPRWMPWWAAVLMVVGVGWGLILASALLHESPESGAGHVGALFFGWALALIWFLPWWAGYGLLRWVRMRWRRRVV